MTSETMHFLLANPSHEAKCLHRMLGYLPGVAGKRDCGVCLPW